jgi:hypothetical protein
VLAQALPSLCRVRPHSHSVTQLALRRQSRGLGALRRRQP